ncbi:poly(3-hydroxyalkanoate) depolymerase [Paracoccus marinaquae]|uniref:Poly(3-hydroxyalkanoate) depolymerase n=1 Tax=Paracoccus marinaquae TaxID=2841926 RepID=A0ABS6AFQ4_9RHOB|nr:poly(3-hydroxyalkanoate) depolymerase [Paracoccus marinaquae]
MTEKVIETIRLSGQDLRYALFGPATAKRTLLVFNGIGASLDTVSGFAARFDDTRILTFDMPGIGGSAVPLLPYRMPWVARLAARLLDALDIAQVDVFGISWGGAPAQQFARDFPRRTRSLTLAATSAGFVMVPGNLSVLMKLVTPKRYLQPDYMLSIGPEIYGGQLRMNTELLREHAAAMVPASQRGYLFQLMAGMGWTSWLWLPQIKAPVLIMMGEDDPIVPVVNGRILAARLPDARIRIMDCGHLFVLTDPQGTAAAVEEFLRRDAGGAAA